MYIGARTSDRAKSSVNISLLNLHPLTKATLPVDSAEIANILKTERSYRDTGQWDCVLCHAPFHPDSAKTHIDVGWFVLSPSYFFYMINLSLTGRYQV